MESSFLATTALFLGSLWTCTRIIEVNLEKNIKPYTITTPYPTIPLLSCEDGHYSFEEKKVSHRWMPPFMFKDPQAYETEKWPLGTIHGAVRPVKL